MNLYICKFTLLFNICSFYEYVADSTVASMISMKLFKLPCLNKIIVSEIKEHKLVSEAVCIIITLISNFSIS